MLIVAGGGVEARPNSKARAERQGTTRCLIPASGVREAAFKMGGLGRAVSEGTAQEQAVRREVAEIGATKASSEALSVSAGRYTGRGEGF